MNMTGGTRAVTIRRLRGILRRKPNEKPEAKTMTEHKRKETTLTTTEIAQELQMGSRKGISPEIH